jgi:hypothetical protein
MIYRIESHTKLFVENSSPDRVEGVRTIEPVAHAPGSYSRVFNWQRYKSTNSIFEKLQG